MQLYIAVLSSTPNPFVFFSPMTQNDLESKNTVKIMLALVNIVRQSKRYSLQVKVKHQTPSSASAQLSIVIAFTAAGQLCVLHMSNHVDLRMT